MPARVKQIWSRIRDFFKNMKKGLKIGLIAGGVALIALVIALVLITNSKKYTILFGGLSQEDLTSVLSYLSTIGVTDTRIENNDTILVNEEQADRLRALVIQQGYPTSGYSHTTLLDNLSPLSSQADREQLRLLDLQDYLANTIKCFDGVANARVTITPGESHRYILDENVSDATAGVFVQMQPGRTLTRNQVSAIQRWVASAEQGLTISNVTVEDGTGSMYMTIDEAEVADDTMRYKLSLEARVNEQTRNNVMAVLVGFFGPENVQVSVHCTVDVTHSYSELLQYYEPLWAQDGSSQGKGIIGSQVWEDRWTNDITDETAGGAVGTTTNTEINEYVTNPDEEDANAGRELLKSGEIIYDVSNEKTQTEHPPGTVTDVSVAIAVNSAKVDLQNPASFVHLAAAAAGISPTQEAEKVAIVSFPFYQDSVNSSGGSVVAEVSMILGLPSWAIYAALAGFALFLALLLIILLLRSKKKKKLAILLAREEEAAAAAAAAAEAAAEAEALAAAAAATQGADIMDVNTEETMRMRQDVRQFVEDNPAIAAQMIKNWLRGETE